jgi:hypothetical protein
MLVVDGGICGHDFKTVFLWSNLGRSFHDGWSGINGCQTGTLDLKQSSGGVKWPRQSLHRCLSELGGGGAPVHGFRWGEALDEAELKGNSPRSSWVSRRRRLGLVAVRCFSVQWRLVVVILEGPSVAVVSKMGSTAPDDAPWPVARAWAAAKWCGGVELELVGNNGEKWEGGLRVGVSYLYGWGS